MVVQPGLKHRKPPTFGHLPVNRARKLKKSWVDSKKIKSQWKAQKKREFGLERKGEEPSEGHALPITNDEKRNDIDEETSDSPRASHLPSNDQAQEAYPGTLGPSLPSVSGRKHQHVSNTAADGKISLRELTREAYSRNSLHTYKSNSKRQEKSSRGNSQRGSTGGGPPSGDQDHRKGQPNMKFRMTAMLERIKRDFT